MLVTYVTALYTQKIDETFKYNKSFTDAIPESRRGEIGWIEKNMIEKYIKQPASWLWYICGPPQMIASMKKILLGMNFPQEKIRIEEWQIPGKA